ncbi:MAG: tetratricopeptide repeat protein, partial [Kangiellaceae bacterium]|nr:tetratricopeptide repeat protein [Kangiellaceae bacterium]
MARTPQYQLIKGIHNMFSHYSIFRRSKSTVNRGCLLVLKHVFLFSMLISPVQASEKLYEKAKSALEQKNYKIAEALFNQLENKKEFKVNALFGLAKISFYSGKLDTAEDYIEEVLELYPTNPEHLFIAARIAGKQAQSASIFTKLGYAKDAKKFFSKALEIDKDHKPSIIGLLRFHQQAPVMAGGDKGAIPALLNRLRDLDKREAFAIEAPMLMSKKEI